MNSGLDEVFEVWGIPHNTDAYSPRLFQCHKTLEAAKAYIELPTNYLGTFQIVRASIHRQLIGIKETTEENKGETK